MRWQVRFGAGVLALGLLASACSSSDEPKLAEAASAETIPPVGGAAGATDTTGTPATTPSDRVELPPLTRTLVQGARGDDVQALQQRLVDLGFDPGEPDGIFGPVTAMAVWAYEKLVLGERGKAVDATVNPAFWDRLAEPSGITPRRPNATPTHLEVYLPEQVAVLFQNGTPRLVTHVSTGSGADWCAEGWCGKAITPGGVYSFGRRYEGWRESKLGRLYNPVYFNYGLAVHGFQSVPVYPASKGCVRIPMHISEYFPELVSRGDQVFVFDGVAEPETYGAQPPPFDTPDPDATTTTTAPSTTVPSTTAPATTAAPTTAPPTTPKPAPTTAPPTTPPPTTAPAPTTSVVTQSAPPPPPSTTAAAATG